MLQSGSLANVARPVALMRDGNCGWSFAHHNRSVNSLGSTERVTPGGTPVALMGLDRVMLTITERARRGGPVPLGSSSANLDHIAHFGPGRQRHGPHLAGGDLTCPTLDVAETMGLRVGLTGGSCAARQLVQAISDTCWRSPGRQRDSSSGIVDGGVSA
jgi:hypothetical protein